MRFPLEAEKSKIIVDREQSIYEIEYFFRAGSRIPESTWPLATFGTSLIAELALLD
jgi:hypothetical protein